MQVRCVLTYFVWLISIESALSQGNWELLIPSGTSNQMVSLYFTDESNGWSVGQYGTITKTTDSGITWKIVETDYLTDLTDVHFPTKSVGYIVGEDGLILMTDNGGATWEKQDIPFSNNLRRVKFRNEQTGWAIGESGLILHTSDGGANWVQQTSGSRYTLAGIDFIDDQRVCVVGYGEVILITKDDGDSWQLIENDFHLSNHSLQFTDVYFANDTAGWACGNTGEPGEARIADTFDGGTSWQLMTTRQSSRVDLRGEGTAIVYQLQQIYFKDDLTTGLYLVDGNASWAGNFPLATTNAGRTWRGYIDGYNEDYAGHGRFQFLTDSTVIATGYHGDLRFSNDSGRNWHFNSDDHRFWDSFQIGPDNTLHVIRRKPIGIGAFDLEFKHLVSNDMGITWNEVVSAIHYLDGVQEEIHNVYDEDMRDPGQFAVTSGSRIFSIHRRNTADTTTSILYSDDMGINYYELRSGIPIRYGLQNWRFLTPDTLIFADVSSYAGPDVVLLSAYSYDGGVTIVSNTFEDVWNDLTPSIFYPPRIHDSFYFDGRTGFFVGDDGNIVKTENTGQSWTNIYSGVVKKLSDIEFINRETGFVVGEFGRILKTVDGGETWRKTDSGTQEDIFCIAFLNESQGWAGTESGMRYTTDGGESWHGVPLRYQHGAIHNIKFDNAGNGYAYTLSGDVNSEWETIQDHSGSYVLFQRMLRNSTSIGDHTEIAAPKPKQISLYSNYPNPFNATTQINYDLAETGYTVLRIFNVQGQIVRTLVDEKKESGEYSVIWDGYSDAKTTVSSGVYIYQLKSNGQIRSRKLLLLK